MIPASKVSTPALLFLYVFVTSTKFNFNVTILVSNDLMASTMESRESKQYLMILTNLEIIEAKLAAELMTE
jgi:hypothetical protein